MVILKKMNLEINIEQELLGQFSAQLNVKETQNALDLDPSMGKGRIQLFTFPNALECYHFTFQLKKALQLNSSNPIDSDYLLLNINLSEKAVEKKVNGQEVNLQKYLPSGILYYPPNIKVSSNSPIDTKFEIVLIRFHKDLLDHYFAERQDYIFDLRDTIVYEDLDVQSEELIRKIITSSNKLKSHADLLSFLSIFFEKLSTRESQSQYENIHPQDLQQLFLASSFLRNPTSQNVPSIDELAKRAGMGKTKFKSIFKQVFGSPPMQYHQKIKMDFAKKALQENLKTSTEIAYDLGYADPSKFSRAFKNHFGSPPSEI